MALTPEDVVNKRFQATKFREGYDQDEVDDFLDEVVNELRRLGEENEDLRAKLGACERRVGELSRSTGSREGSDEPAPVLAAASAPQPVVQEPVRAMAAPMNTPMNTQMSSPVDATAGRNASSAFSSASGVCA